MQRPEKEMQVEEISFARIVVKFHDHARINYIFHPDATESILQHDRNGQWQAFIKAFPLIQINKLFTSISPDKLNNVINKARSLDAGYRPPNLLTYYVFSCPSSIDANEVLLKLSAFSDVELAYFQSLPVQPGGVQQKKRPPVFAGAYLDPSPAGINAKYAWELSDGRGTSSVKFIDIEQGWHFDERVDVNTLPLTGINHPHFRDHGAAVLSIILMKNENGKGPGIAPGVSGYVMSQWRIGGEPNDADAVMAAITYLDFGDVLLLETQSFYSPSSNKLWPAEIQEGTFQAIRLATALGIIVIEAAGNGDSRNASGNDLDRFQFNNKKILNPASRDFKDSGAIIVAASSMDWPYRRINYSNYGKRVNCFAWGEGVAIGENDSASSFANQRYPAGFDGTSSASAIIAGATLAIQSISEERYHTRLGPLQMRRILSSDRYGTASANGHKIGVMPDLKKIIDHGLPVPLLI